MITIKFDEPDDSKKIYNPIYVEDVKLSSTEDQINKIWCITIHFKNGEVHTSTYDSEEEAYKMLEYISLCMESISNK